MLSQKLLISSFVYILYFWYLNRMFENDRSYQYLTEIEREMSLTSEQSLYYYYYKVLINDDANNNNNNDDFVPKNFTELLVEKIFNDDRSQAPNIVNAFKVLTILPEILLAISYRTMRTILIQYFRVDFDQDWRRCYLVENIIDENDHDQNNNQPNSIISTCEGIGEPFYFYIYSIFAINGFVPILIGWIAYYIGNHSICSMIMAIIMFTLNQTQSSRVQWAVPLRENFGYPLFLFHQLYLIKYLYSNRKSLNKNNQQSTLLSSSSSYCWLILLILTQLLCWQFSSFILLIQTFSLYTSIELLPNIINYHHNHHSDNNEKFIQKYFLINIAATILQSLLQLGNVFVLRSPYFLFISSYISSSLLLPIIIKNNFSSITMTKRKQTIIKFISIMIIIVWNIIVSKYLHLQIKLDDDDDSSHIWSILATKFNLRGFENFHNFMYTCSKEYDWIDWQDMLKITCNGTFIGPLTILALLLRFRWILKKNNQQNRLSTKSLPFIYHCIMTGCFTAMAIMIMRLKLLMMPQLAISVGLIFTNHYNNKKLDQENRLKKSSSSSSSMKYKYNGWFDWLILSIIIGLVSIKSYPMMREYLEQQQQFSNESFENILNAVQQRTPSDSIIGGSMSTMATVMLSTGRKIANNPFYESSSIRHRTYRIYQIYSERPFRAIHKDLCGLQLQYIIIETIYCYGHFGQQQKQHCRMIDIWRHDDERINYWQQQHGQQHGQPDKHKPDGHRLCHLLIGRPNNNGQEEDVFKYFELIASNDLYHLYKIVNCR
ncbi:hypothetical protein DERF_010494 [Dermatophagoides farinae]|uniref:Uncharacterized protein n=1 Tax=Dermatophagoides farinae TaxID=6954 RepID=A0A922HW87_DERFA|nr:hypothetical protein DERF_010494 [Dermatophagoides farinae]